MLCPGVGDSSLESPFRVISQLATSSWVSCTCTLLVFKARCLEGLIFQVQVLKDWVPDVGFSGRSSGFELPPGCGTLCQGWGLWRACVSASVSCFRAVSLSSAPSAGVTQLVLRLFSIEIVPNCSYRFSVSLGGSELRTCQNLTLAF